MIVYLKYKDSLKMIFGTPAVGTPMQTVVAVADVAIRVHEVGIVGVIKPRRA